MRLFGKHITKKSKNIVGTGKLISLALVIVMILALSGCSNSTNGNGDAGENVNSSLSISDETEKEVNNETDNTKNKTSGLVEQKIESEENTEKPERVIALSKSNAELWVLAGGKLVATSDDAMDIEGLNTDAVSLGDMDHVSLEMIAALNPDLLILFSTDPAQKALGEAAEGIGINVYYTNIDGFGDYEKVMTDFTTRTGETDLYQKNVLDVRKEIDTVISNTDSEKKSGTYLCLHVSATKSKVEKNDYFACEIFNDLGLQNLAADTSAFDELSLEAIVAYDPDYIFVIPRGSEEKALASFAEIFSSEPAWENLSAVKNGKYYLLSKDLFGLKPNANWGEAYRQAYEIIK